MACNSKLEDQARFCPSHAQAEKKLREGYSDWSRAYGAISLENYLARLAKLSETGERVKELVQYYQSSPDKWTEKQA